MIFPSTIITGSEQMAIQKLNQLLAEIGLIKTDNNPDVFVINHNTGYSIEIVRTLSQFLSRKPYNHTNKAIIIFNSHLLQTEAQNCLLKNLEEPGKGNYFFLITDNPSNLLPTILSRCQVQKTIPNNESTTPILKISGNIAADLNQSATLVSGKEETLAYLQSLLKSYPASAKNLNLLRKIIKAIQLVKANVDPQSALDYIFLS